MARKTLKGHLKSPKTTWFNTEHMIQIDVFCDSLSLGQKL